MSVPELRCRLSYSPSQEAKAGNDFNRVVKIKNKEPFDFASKSVI